MVVVVVLLVVVVVVSVVVVVVVIARVSALAPLALLALRRAANINNSRRPKSIQSNQSVNRSTRVWEGTGAKRSEGQRERDKGKDCRVRFTLLRVMDMSAHSVVVVVVSHFVIVVTCRPTSELLYFLKVKRKERSLTPNLRNFFRELGCPPTAPRSGGGGGGRLRGGATRGLAGLTLVVGFAAVGFAVGRCGWCRLLCRLLCPRCCRQWLNLHGCGARLCQAERRVVQLLAEGAAQHVLRRHYLLLPHSRVLLQQFPVLAAANNQYPRVMLEREVRDHALQVGSGRVSGRSGQVSSA